jgi:hypothetical protein
MTNLSVHCSVAIPTWDERAEIEIKQQLYDQNKDTLKAECNDPVMQQK